MTAIGQSATVPVTVTPRARRRAIVAGAAGNLVEWYDWFAYSSFALYFAKHFFPEGDQTARLLQTAAVFAIGFMVRPLGAWLMGLYADRAGRRAALTWSVGLMCLGSFGIALLPDYGAIGALAPIGLVLARIVQGLSLGGEYGASATYMSEMAEQKRRGFWSSLHVTSVMMGQLSALLVLIVLQRLLSTEALEAWGWRIPFVIGGLLAVTVFWIRRGCEESVSFVAAQAAGEPPATARLLFRRHPKQAFIVFALTAGGGVAFYAYTTYMQKFLVNTTGFSRETATGLTAAALVFFMLIQAPLGALSDRFGRKPLLIFAFTTGVLATYPVMSALAVATAPLAAFGLMAILIVILSGYTSVNAVVKAELFPANVRGLGVALPYAFANAVFGGTAEYVALWFKKVGIETGFYVYVSAAMALSLLVTLLTRDTGRNSEILED
jgi:MFS transporter, MHS family, alpha-ketoglutarate permease